MGLGVRALEDHRVEPRWSRTSMILFMAQTYGNARYNGNSAIGRLFMRVRHVGHYTG